jgi:ribose/xylose/arabinose/galactoside ABC-type transport system permease subunit
VGLLEVTKPHELETDDNLSQSGSNGSGPASFAAAGLESALNLFRAVPLLPVVLLTGIVLSVAIDGFLSVPNLQNIMRQTSVILLAACGETMVLLIGGIDLSVGATIGLASVCGAFAMRFTDSVPLGVVACVATGLGVGALNGVGIARVGIPPFIMTFGMLLLARATSYLLTQSKSIGRLPQPVLAGGVLNVLDIPLIFITAGVVALIIGLILSRTVFGQKVYLTGSNPQAALFSGINVRQLTFYVYLIAGLLAGIAGFVFLMRLGAARPDAGDPLLLPIIGAVVVGGTALTGGEGGILRTVTGSLLIAMLIKSLEILGAQFWDQMIVIGVLIALGSALGSWLSRRRTSESRQKARHTEKAAENTG